MRETTRVQGRRSAGRVAVATLVGATLTAVSGCAGATPAPVETEAGSGSITAAAIERLGAAPCAEDAFAEIGIGADGLLCGLLRVPLDYADPSAGAIDLAVTLTDVDDAAGVLLLIGGGPGGSSGWSVPITRAVMPEVADRLQLVALDLRGTGDAGLDCPEVQAATGTSDILPAPAPAVAACAEAIADWRPHLSTDDSVEDLERLREALGGPVWIPDGTSYGTFVAQRYAMAYPDTVEALVLDSPVPGDAVDPFLLSSMQAVPGLLEAVCVAEDCVTDPLADLVAVLAAGYDELRLFNALVSMSTTTPDLPGVVDALAVARSGDTTPLDALVAEAEAMAGASTWMFSAATHIGTLCLDTPMPWGAAVTDPTERAARLDEAVGALPAEATYPFSRALAAQVASVSACVVWPESARGSAGTLPDVPILLVAGDRDLSTPVADAEAIAAGLPSATLVTIPGGGHGLQTTRAGADALRDFLLALRD